MPRWCRTARKPIFTSGYGDCRVATMSTTSGAACLARAPRRDSGLPEDALVLACLNQTYKLRRPFFSVWMEALRSQSDAVLWLLAGHPRAQANLRAEAAKSGVDPARLIFARRAAQDAHVARVACADLALDTLPYGAHTTGVDALWAGVPMLTCRGDTFAGRVGASLLIRPACPSWWPIRSTSIARGCSALILRTGGIASPPRLSRSAAATATRCSTPPLSPVIGRPCC